MSDDTFWRHTNNRLIEDADKIERRYDLIARLHKEHDTIVTRSTFALSIRIATEQERCLEAANEIERLQTLADNRGGAVRWLLTCLERSSPAVPGHGEQQHRAQAIAFAWSTIPEAR